MTLPHGFGSKDRGNRHVVVKKCKLGKPCGNYHDYSTERCRAHQWTKDHSDAWFSIMFGIGIIVALLVIIGIAMTYFYFDDLGAQPFYNNIDNMNCQLLAEYIADKEREYDYAEHRYEWLCVYEQIKEFQG